MFLLFFAYASARHFVVNIHMHISLTYMCARASACMRLLTRLDSRIQFRIFAIPFGLWRVRRVTALLRPAPTAIVKKYGKINENIKSA